MVACLPDYHADHDDDHDVHDDDHLDDHDDDHAGGAGGCLGQIGGGESAFLLLNCFLPLCCRGCTAAPF